jgi:hypothetical protein
VRVTASSNRASYLAEQSMTNIAEKKRSPDGWRLSCRHVRERRSRGRAMNRCSLCI